MRVASVRRERPVRDCWLAVNLSGIVPGLGQCYSGQWTKGLVIMGSFFAIVLHAFWSLMAAEGSTVRAFWLLAIAFLSYLITIWDAFATAGRPLHPIGSKHTGRDLWYGVFLSQILPGLGQLYLNQAIAGVVFLSVGVALAMGSSYQPVLMPLACTIWAISGYHAYRVTPLTPGRNDSRSGQWLTVVVAGGLLVRLGIGGLPMWIDQAVLQCTIPSESMLPTLQVGDRTFVSRNQLYYPQTGDIVVFTVPPKAMKILNSEPETLFVKRIIGLPGQTVEVRDSQVWIDKTPLTEDYINEPSTYRWGPQLIPPNTYFVLGDNRNESADSHVWGLLPKKNLIGEAYKIVWPPERVQSLRR